jgi:hypothetical protein
MDYGHRDARGTLSNWFFSRLLSNKRTRLPSAMVVRPSDPISKSVFSSQKAKKEARDKATMKYRLWILGGVGLLGIILPCLPSFGGTAIGFGVGAPPAFPIQWPELFPFILVETPVEGNLTFLFTLGVYPSEVGLPEVFEVDTNLLIKAWVGPATVFAGGGLAIQWDPLSLFGTWIPLIHVMAGTQLWILDSFALFVHVRSLDLLPPTWSLDPMVTLGAELGFGKVRPVPLRLDGEYLWLLVGVSVLAILAYYPRI